MQMHAAIAMHNLLTQCAWLSIAFAHRAHLSQHTTTIHTTLHRTHTRTHCIVLGVVVPHHPRDITKQLTKPYEHRNNGTCIMHCGSHRHNPGMTSHCPLCVFNIMMLLPSMSVRNATSTYHPCVLWPTIAISVWSVVWLRAHIRYTNGITTSIGHATALPTQFLSRSRITCSTILVNYI